MGIGWIGDPVETVHSVPPPGYRFTACCRVDIDELDGGDRLTSDHTQVTCPFGLRGQFGVNSIVNRKAELMGRAEGALSRLLGVRALLVRASSSEVSDEFRKQLLSLIDHGSNKTPRPDQPLTGN